MIFPVEIKYKNIFFKSQSGLLLTFHPDMHGEAFLSEHKSIANMSESFPLSVSTHKPKYNLQLSLSHMVTIHTLTAASMQFM